MKKPNRFKTEPLLFLLFFAVIAFPGWGVRLYAAESDRTVKIASIYAWSGPAAEANATSVRGIRMAIEELNAKGGVLGRPLELLEFDNLSTPIGSKVAAQQAIEKGVVAILGAAFSSHSIAIAKVAQENGVPMISNVSTSPGLTRIGNYIFRICFDDLLQGRVMGEFAYRELAARSAVILYDLTSDYSMGLSAAFEKAFMHQGGKVLAKLPYTPRQPNFREILAQTIKEDPDVLFVPGYDESARIIRQAVENGMKPDVIPIGGDGWDEVSFFNQGGDQIQSAYYTTHWSQTIQSERTRLFVSKFGPAELIVAPTALAYDAVMLLADAIGRAGSVEPAAIRAALEATDEFRGVTGTISFNEYGDPVKRVVMMKIENGHPVYLKPVHAEGDTKQ